MIYADIYCTGGKCVMKDKCKRYKRNADHTKHRFFVKPPFKIKKGVFSCEMIYGDSQKLIMGMLKNIVS